MMSTLNKVEMPLTKDIIFAICMNPSVGRKFDGNGPSEDRIILNLGHLLLLMTYEGLVESGRVILETGEETLLIGALSQVYSH